MTRVTSSPATSVRPFLRPSILPGPDSVVHLAEVTVRRTIIDHTAMSYVLADSSKLGEIAVHRVCTLDRLTAVLTDDAQNSAAFAALAAAGLTLLRARVTEQPEATAAGGRPRLTAAP